MKTEFIGLCAPLVDDAWKESSRRGMLDARQTRAGLELLEKCLDAAAQGDEKKTRRTLAKALLHAFDQDGTAQIADPALKKTAALLRNSVVRQGERESLARNLSMELVEDVLHWSPAQRREIADALRSAAGAIPGRGGIEGDALVPLANLTRVLWKNSLDRLSDDEFHEFLAGLQKIFEQPLEKESSEPAMTALVLWVLKKYGALKAMKKAFMGLLLGEMALKTAASGLGLDKNVSLTDFIILIGVKIARKEAIPKINPARLEEVKRGVAEMLKN